MAFQQKGKMDKESFHKRVSSKIAQIDSLSGLQCCSARFNSWRESTEALIRDHFGPGRELDDFNAIFYTPLFLSCRMDDSAFDEACRKGLEEARTLLARLKSR